MATKKTKERNTPRSTASISRRMRTGTKKQSPPLTISDEDLYERVSRRAYELYQMRGEEPGHDLADWFTAERLVKEELLHGPVTEEPLVIER